MISMEIQWSLVIFTVLAGAGAWAYFAFCLSALTGNVRNDRTRLLACVVTLVMLVVGGLASVTHLSHPDRIMAVFSHPTMGIFTEALFVALVGIAVVAYLLVWRRGAGEGAQKALLVVGAVLAVLLTLMLGYSYMMASRPSWNTPLLPLAYVFTASSGGAALYLLVAALGKEGEQATRFASVLLMAGGVLAGVTALAFGLAAGTIGAEAAPLWLAVVLCGAVVPLALGYAVRVKPAQTLMLGVTAFVFALVGCAAFRCVMWATGTAVRNYFGLA